MSADQPQKLTFSPVGAMVAIILLGIGFVGRLQIQSQESDMLTQRNHEPIRNIARIDDESVPLDGGGLQFTPAGGWTVLQVTGEPDLGLVVIHPASGCLARLKPIGQNELVSPAAWQEIQYTDVTVHWMVDMEENEREQKTSSDLPSKASAWRFPYRQRVLYGRIEMPQGNFLLQVCVGRPAACRDWKEGPLADLCNGFKALR
ncbi:hypothetical protein [Stieleria varia]|uniref:Uncharacterized protein n=1 Tax=Stieleria varia TaxID=2528005 RepID=A0A5C6B0X1_9BACT|nr:hypothetical protein [Stieleria varia]TWU05558.1 hypothetical protein Pla52n_12720 [Stieleria varia]